MRVLIVEDDPIQQYYTSEMMRLFGYDFVLVENGVEAVEQARVNGCDYDVCLMDIDMPVMNGIEATRMIRIYEVNLPIIAFTANHDIERDCLDAGMDAFLSKPCTPDVLQRALVQFADGYLSSNQSGQEINLNSTL